MEGVAVGMLGVPRGQARGWLGGSGCGNVFLRPYWSASTGEAVARSNFSLLWLRGQAEHGAKLWEGLNREKGVCGLLVQGRDLAIRVTQEASVAPLEAQAAHLLGAKSDFKIRRAVEGRRWWKIGPLQLHDEWHMQELIARFGLAALPGSLAVSKAGPFRSFAFFASVGSLPG